MIRLPPGYTRSYTPFPYTTLIRSLHGWSPREGRCIHRMPAEEAWCCCWFDRITALAVSASATQDLPQSLELLWCFHRCTPLAMSAHSIATRSRPAASIAIAQHTCTLTTPKYQPN